MKRKKNDMGESRRPIFGTKSSSAQMPAMMAASLNVQLTLTNLAASKTNPA
jgi:hypothetical protein